MWNILKLPKSKINTQLKLNRKMMLPHWCCGPNQMNLTIYYLLIFKLLDICTTINMYCHTYNLFCSLVFENLVLPFFFYFFHLINRYMGCHAKIFLDIVKRIFWVARKLLWWIYFSTWSRKFLDSNNLIDKEIVPPKNCYFFSLTKKM